MQSCPTRQTDPLLIRFPKACNKRPRHKCKQTCRFLIGTKLARPVWVFILWRTILRKHSHLTAFVAFAALAVLGKVDTALAQNLVATPNPVNFNVQTGGTTPSQNVN